MEYRGGGCDRKRLPRLRRLGPHTSRAVDDQAIRVARCSRPQQRYIGPCRDIHHGLAPRADDQLPVIPLRPDGHDVRQARAAHRHQVGDLPKVVNALDQSSQCDGDAHPCSLLGDREVSRPT